MSAYKTEFASVYHLRDIAQMAPFNYTLDKKKSSAGWAVLKGNDGNTILVKNTSSAADSFFYNPDIPHDKGKLLKFVASRLTTTNANNLSKDDIMESIKWLSKLDGTDLAIELDNANKRALIKKEKSLDMSKAYNQKMNLIPLKDEKFLTETRCISKETIENPKFAPTIFNTIVKQDNGHIFYNTAFAKLNAAGDPVMLEIRNSNFKNISLDHNQVWNSITDNDKPIDAVFISESTLDSLAYFEINQERISQTYSNPLFVSTSGNIYQKKWENIFSEINNLGGGEHSDIITTFDNDNNGRSYDLQTLSMYSNEYYQKNSLIVENEFFDILSFPEDIPDNILNEISQIAQIYNDQVKVSTDSDYGQYVIIKKIENKDQLFLPKIFKSSRKFMNKLGSVLTQNKSSFFIHKANSDWNAELMPKKKLIQSNINTTKTLKI